MSRLGPVVAVVCSLAASAAESRPAQLIYPNGIAFDTQGSAYISDIGLHQILKLTPNGRLSVVAGTGEAGFGGDGGTALQARLFGPQDLAFDAQGSLLIADTLNHRIRRIDRRGVISTVAGTGAAGYDGDGGPAAAAKLNGPQAITFDRDGAMLIADTYNHVVRRIDRSGVITTFAGSEPGLSGDGGPAVKARISLPMDVAVAPDGTVYIAEAGNSRVRRVTADGAIQTIIGYGIGSGLGGAGYSGDGGAPDKAQLFSPAGVACDASGALYISDSGNNRVRVIRDGVITTVAGSGETGFGGDSRKATDAVFNTPQKIAFGPGGRLFIADRANGRVRVVERDGVIRTLAGDAKPKGFILAFPEQAAVSKP